MSWVRVFWMHVCSHGLIDDRGVENFESLRFNMYNWNTNGDKQ